MEGFERVFMLFMTYVAPFYLLLIAYDGLRRRPRTKWSLFWTGWSVVFGILGLINLVSILLGAA
jgi:hypothetical protein